MISYQLSVIRSRSSGGRRQLYSPHALHPTPHTPPPTPHAPHPTPHFLTSQISLTLD
ncbi:MAG: hypothetical protein PX640_14015 [Microcystis sp. M49629_WE12]|nr:hypothetical protein [Microcystis sp. M49629_WE12]